MTRPATTKKSRPGAPQKAVKPVGPHYEISVADARAHLFAVRLTVHSPDPAGQHLSLPVWIPGSYMVREFARNIIEISAFAEGEKRRRAIGLTKLDKSSWLAERCDQPLVVEYLVYSWDLSVRCSHLDASHGFFNGTSVFLSVAGLEHQPHTVTIVAPDDPTLRDWRVATTLNAERLNERGFGDYSATDYDELIDHPVEMGTFLSIRFNALDTPHDVVITGPAPGLDAKKLAADLKLICETQIRMFDPSARRAPFRRYAFLTMMIDEGFGGLEHRSSTALMCSRDGLPKLHQEDRDESYRTFLGVASHEYFHSWNVKRIKPAAFAPYRLDRENYTRLLWIFEGFTSYYDDLVLVRCGILSETQYLKVLGKTISEVSRGRGAARQSVAESSFDAWTKYYRQDENSPNAIVSYYRKGSLIGLGLDLRIRARTRGRKSLDDVMRYLWKRFGEKFYEGKQEGLGEGDFVESVRTATGVDVSQEVRAWAYGTTKVPLEDLFQPFSIAIENERQAPLTSLGIKSAADASGCRIVNAYEGEAAHAAGLSAGDVIVAIDHLRVSAQTLPKVLKRYAPGHSVEIHAFRRDQLLQVRLRLDDDAAEEIRLVSKRSNKLRAAWLEGNP
jgi:predicted metalloprotease with PDZ domain